MTNATGDVATVELATPKDWRDLAWAFGMKMGGTQTQSFDALLHGSGVQSVLAYRCFTKTTRPYRVKHATFTVRRGRVVAIKLS